jgi:hypothetical protein
VNVLYRKSNEQQKNKDSHPPCQNLIMKIERNNQNDEDRHFLLIAIRKEKIQIFKTNQKQKSL